MSKLTTQEINSKYYIEAYKQGEAAKEIFRDSLEELMEIAILLQYLDVEYSILYTNPVAMEDC